MTRFFLPNVLLLSASALLSGAEQPGVSKSDKPSPPSQAAAPEKPAIKHLGGPDYELKGIRFNETTRSIIIPARVNMIQGLLEYALVHESGKAHESFLTTTISPYDLNVVLLLLNFTPSSTFFDFSDKEAGAMPVKNPKEEPKASLLVTLEWKGPDGKTNTARLESLLLNIDQTANAKEGPFTYTGSMVMEDGAFLAKATGSILALYADPAALINNPRKGNDNDDAWIADKTKVPAKDTEITLKLTPAK